MGGGAGWDGLVLLSFPVLLVAVGGGGEGAVPPVALLLKDVCL